MDSNPKKELRRKIDQGKANAQNTQYVLEEMTRHHEDYVRVLELSPGDIGELVKQKGRIGMYPTIEDELEAAVLTFDIENETFGIAVKHVCYAPYGRDWANRLMVGCKSNPSLNISAGYGTTLIFTVSEEWHNKVISRLTENETSPPE